MSHLLMSSPASSFQNGGDQRFLQRSEAELDACRPGHGHHLRRVRKCLAWSGILQEKVAALSMRQATFAMVILAVSLVNPGIDPPMLPIINLFDDLLRSQLINYITTYMPTPEILNKLWSISRLRE